MEDTRLHLEFEVDLIQSHRFCFTCITGTNLKDSQRNSHFIKDIHVANGQMTRRSTPLSPGSNKLKPQGGTTACTQGWAERKWEVLSAGSGKEQRASSTLHCGEGESDRSRTHAPSWLGARPGQRPVGARPKAHTTQSRSSTNACGQERPDCGASHTDSHVA